MSKSAVDGGGKETNRLHPQFLIKELGDKTIGGIRPIGHVVGCTFVPTRFRLYKQANNEHPDRISSLPLRPLLALLKLIRASSFFILV